MADLLHIDVYDHRILDNHAISAVLYDINKTAGIPERVTADHVISGGIADNGIAGVNGFQLRNTYRIETSAA
jgi:hypothetical protein